MSNIRSIATSGVEWGRAVRIVRDIYPRIDLFEDVADPSDWPLVLSALEKARKKLPPLGNLNLVPADRRVGGKNATYLMAPFTHCSTERPSRFSDGQFGVLYIGERFDVALRETIHHHRKFMAATREPKCWTENFRELLVDVSAALHDLRGDNAEFREFLAPDYYQRSQRIGAELRHVGAEGLVYPSIRSEKGDCVALFYPDLAKKLALGRNLAYHWNGEDVDQYRIDGEITKLTPT